MALKFPSVDVLLVVDLLMASSVGQLVSAGGVDDEVHCSGSFSAALCTSPSLHRPSLLLPFLLVEAVDPGFVCVVLLVHALVLFLLELDDLVLLASHFAAWREHYGLVEGLVEGCQPLDWLNSHTHVDKLDIAPLALNVDDVLWQGPSLPGATSVLVRR